MIAAVVLRAPALSVGMTGGSDSAATTLWLVAI